MSSPTLSDGTNVILRSTEWPDNGHLIADAFRLIDANPDTAKVLDVTYGKGNWWTQIRPTHLDARSRELTPGHDFRLLPDADETFDVVAYDPPYVAQGGRSTSTVPDMLHAFGLTDVPSTHPALMRLILAGFIEASRVLCKGGFVLVKCMPYVTGGRMRDVPHELSTIAPLVGMEAYDRLDHVSGVGPQPAHVRQLHARANGSVLAIYKKSHK